LRQNPTLNCHASGSYCLPPGKIRAANGEEERYMHPDLVEYGPVRFHSDPNALYDRHLVFDYAIDPDLATPRERYEAVARSLRDVLALRWLRTKKTHYQLNP